jgi:NADH:ubiquinone oxidoreductase subunit F (NADH-binding)
VVGLDSLPVLKWSFAQKNAKVMLNICFAMLMKETRAYMDRSILEGDHYSVIEGMAIGAYAIGASQVIYVRAEYPFGS